MTFEVFLQRIQWDIWPRVKDFLMELHLRSTEIWDVLPGAIHGVLTLAFYLALVGVCISLALAFYHNFKTWKPAPNSKLMLSYFCGSGNHQRKLMYKEAMNLLYDKKWSWISAAGVAFRLGNYGNESKGILFVCTLAYIPLSILGFFEMLIRDVIGTILFAALSVAFGLAFLCIGLIIRVLIPLCRLIDRTLRVEQHCPHCYTAFRLPDFKCPHCGEVHKELAPSQNGLFFAKCSCGHFIPCSVMSKRSKLVSVCPNPKCSQELATSNAKQFFIQIIGGNSAGKTAFMAAFQHLYIKHGSEVGSTTVSGEPKDVFSDLEQMFNGGDVEASSTTEIATYNFVHQSGQVAEQSLIFYDIPDEVLLSDEYERSPLNFGYTDGIVILIDPLSVSSVRKECIAAGEIKNTDRFSTDDPESIIVYFINKFSEIAGRSARRMSETPVAVVIVKSDIKSIKRHIGMPKIKAQYKKSPEQYGNSLETARDTICRDYLNEIGLSNVINNLESVFSEISYFSASALGHGASRGIPFEPIGVVEPIAWIAAKQQSATSNILSAVKSVVTEDGFHEKEAERNLAERYVKAERYYTTGAYREATDTFDSLGGYKDASARAEKIRAMRLDLAKRSLEKQNFDEAIQEFKALGNYGGAQSFIPSAIHQKAEYLLRQQNFPEAISTLEELDQDDTISNMVKRYKYSYAQHLEAQGDYINALKIYSSIQEYMDASQKAGQLLPGLIKQGVRRDLSFGRFTWRVLDVKEDCAFLVTEKCVGASPYHTAFSNITWDHASIRNYLNTTFLDSFSGEEKNRILSMKLPIATNSDYNTPAGVSTVDRAFLLSIADARDYFADDADRSISDDTENGSVEWWWLRSPGGDETYAAIVEKGGKVNPGGNKVNNPNGGLRVAVWIEI